jgi:hypothetical protein
MKSGAGYMFVAALAVVSFRCYVDAEAMPHGERELDDGCARSSSGRHG